MFTRRALLAGVAAATILPKDARAWTHGTQLGSNGFLSAIVGWAAANNNMLATSGPFGQATPLNNSDFTLTGATLTSGIAGPDGNTNSWKLVNNSAGGNHFIQNFFGAQSVANVALTFRIAVIAKAAELTRLVLLWEILSNESVVSASTVFDLAGVQTGFDNTTGSQTTIVSTTIQDIGNGWRLCILDAKYTGTPLSTVWTHLPHIYLDNGSGTAPRSISYTGDGTSGINVFWLSNLPKAFWQITAQTFRDDFTSLSTIDLSNTRNPGFNWYINNNAPNSPNTVYFDPSTLPPSVPGSFTLSSPSILQINNPGANQAPFSALMYSVGFPVGGGYVGQAWQAPLALDWYVSWDSTLDPTKFSNLGPALWGDMVEGMVAAGQDGMNPTYHFPEWDVTDIGGTTMSLFDSFLPTGPGSIPDVSHKVGQSPTISMAFGTFYRLTGIWANIPATGDGWGIFMNFFNGKMIPESDIAYSPDDHQTFGNNLVAGQFSQFDSWHQPIFMDTGSSNNATPGGWPMLIDYAQVYQAPAIPKSYAYWNIFDQSSQLTLSSPSTSQPGAQLAKTASGTVWSVIRSRTGKSSGKWYWEITLGGAVNSATSLMLGIMGFGASVTSTNFPGSSSNGAGARHGSNWDSFVSGVTGKTSSAVTFANNDVFGFAFDADAGIMYIHRNGTYINGSPGSGNGVWGGLTGDTWYPAAAIHDASVSTITANFGYSSFAFSLPGGYNSGLY